MFLCILSSGASIVSRCFSEKRVVWTLFMPVVPNGVSTKVFCIGTNYVQDSWKYGQQVVQSWCFFQTMTLYFIYIVYTFASTKSIANNDNLIVWFFFGDARSFSGSHPSLRRNARQAFRDLDLDKDGKVSRHLWQHNSWVENIRALKHWCVKYVRVYQYLYTQALNIWCIHLHLTRKSTQMHNRSYIEWLGYRLYSFKFVFSHGLGKFLCENHTVIQPILWPLEHLHFTLKSMGLSWPAESHANMFQTFLDRNQPRQELRFFVKHLWHHLEWLLLEIVCLQVNVMKCRWYQRTQMPWYYIFLTHFDLFRFLVQQWHFGQNFAFMKIGCSMLTSRIRGS